MISALDFQVNTKFLYSLLTVESLMNKPTNEVGGFRLYKLADFSYSTD